MQNGRQILHYEFGPFRIDPREKVLFRRGETLHITPKAFEVLLALVEGHGHTLSKEELLERVWADTFVEIGNLNRNVSTLRSILGDDPHEPVYIKTIPKRGYRFDSEVCEILERDGEVSNSSSSEDQNLFETAPRRDSGKLIMLFGTAIGLVLIALLLAYTARNGNISVSNQNRQRPVNHEAQAMFDRARSLWGSRKGDSLYEATVLLEQTVAAYPDFALAHAALADAYAFDTKNRAKAIESANRAIELDPSLGEPHATLGFVKMFWEWRFDEAESHFREAISLSPDYATGHQWYALNLRVIGQGHAGLVEMKKAAELEPNSLAINADLCQMLYFVPLLDEAESQCRKTVEMDPTFTNASVYLYDVLMAKGSHDEAVALFFRNEASLKHFSTRPQEIVELRNAYDTGGIIGFWRKLVDMLEKGPAFEYKVAQYHARLGDREKVFYWLNRSVERQDLNFLFFQAEPLFIDCCYSDPRFAELQQRFREIGSSPQ
ncbi:MAG: winged helix-turn-helix domain-containing protein [Pyrinomonadaceae bacterium]